VASATGGDRTAATRATTPTSGRDRVASRSRRPTHTRAASGYPLAALFFCHAGAWVSAASAPVGRRGRG
jgi:hypothetical protein